MTDDIHLTDDQVERLRRAIEPFLDTEFEEPDRWRKMSDAELWWFVVGQIAVIGGAAGGERLSVDRKARKALQWERLVELDDAKALVELSTHMRRAGVRFVGDGPRKDRKSEALVANLRVIEEAGGPKKYFRRVARKKKDLDRVKLVTRDLTGFGPKSSRDLLTNLGMVRDFIAFDSRIQKVLGVLGIEEVKFGDAEEYRVLEDSFRAAVPKLGVGCLAHLDRILFRNTDAVVERLTSDVVPNSVSFVLGDEEYAELRELAEERGLGVGEMARRIVVGVVGGMQQRS